ncbi:stealth conserved region 3 domain-containing protein [Pedococcus dokdonensis]|uniref:stealth conserved region 3 domain-containing protein n=1 Tax=Pedococcus dokdonensis TaxID=443156 RepID=UPI000B038693|nr:stealth conserved region 3 domain-containing protein [Pedococcus dokdonensis]
MERDPEGHLSSPNNNPLASRIWRSTAEAMDQRSGAWALEDLLPAPAAEVVPFDVDWVFSWVDASDPNWQEMFAAWAPEEASDASDRSRFATRDDLKFALRSLELYAPWIRTIHVLTNCRPPEWLDVDHPRINWVDHTDVFEAEHLPTFSSHAIETVVHRIPGLADHFVYSNDDFFLTRRTEPADFFHANGIARLRLEPYGIVNGPATPGDPDYLNGARNSAALLADEFGRTPVRLHTHSPQSMNRTVLAEMEGKYADAFTRTRANRFRDSTDIAVTGFLYHHYAFLTGRAVPDGGTTLLIQQNHRYARLFAQLLAAQDTGQLSKYLSVCVNDGRGSHDNADWDAQARSFLQSYFAEKSSFER